MIRPFATIEKNLIRQLAVTEQDETLEECIVAVFLVVSGGGFCSSKVLSMGLKAVVDAIEYVQIIVHLGLVDCQAVARVEKFLNYILEVVNFELYNPAEHLLEHTGLESQDPRD